MATFEIEFSIKKEVESVVGKLPKRLKKKSRAYDYGVIKELMDDLLPVIYSGATVRDVVREVNYAMNKSKDSIKSGLIKRIENESGLDWDDIKGQDSFGMTRAQRVERSFNNTKNIVKSKAKRYNQRYKKAVRHAEKGSIGMLSHMGLAPLGVSQKQAAESVAKTIAEELASAIGKTLGASESRVVSTEAVAAKHLKFIEEHKFDTVKWVTAADERVCPECGPLDGLVFATADNAPMIPRHPNCRCELEVLEPKTV